MAATIEFVVNGQGVGEVVLSESENKTSKKPGLYLEVFFVDSEDRGLSAETPYNPETQSQCVSIDNTLFGNVNLESIARSIATHLKMGNVVEVVFKSEGRAIKRQTVKRTNYWFFVDGGAFAEKLRLIISEPML